MKKIARDIYQTFIRKIYNKPVFIFELNEKQEKLLSTFLATLTKEYGDSLDVRLIYDYFIFQFDYWLDKSTRADGSIIPANWVMGKKAIERWSKRSNKFSWYNARKKVEGYGLSLNRWKKEETLKPWPALKTKEWEEDEKKRFYNKDEGFANCIEATSMFNHRSSLCTMCKFKKDCKAELILQMPRVAHARGYLDEVPGDKAVRDNRAAKRRQ